VIFRGLKNSRNLDFSAVSWDLEGRAHPKKKFHGFPARWTGFEIWVFCGFPRFLGDPKISRNVDFSAVLRDFEGWACPKFFKTRTSPQFSWDFEGMDPPKN
jgi:hypothetical protein